MADLVDLADRIERAMHRVELLRDSSHRGLPTHAWEEAALEELTRCLDALRAAEEQLKVLSVKLVAARHELASRGPVGWRRPRGGAAEGGRAAGYLAARRRRRR